MSQDPSSSGRIDYRLVHELGLAKNVSGELTFGRVEISYSNNALTSLCEFLIGIKDLPMFRDLNLVPSYLLPKQKKSKTPEEASLANKNLKTNEQVKSTLRSLIESKSKTAIGNDHKKLRQVGNII